MDYLTMDENVCPVCGKVFHTIVGRDWGWSYKGSKYCSYHCMRHVEVRHRVAMGWQQDVVINGASDLTSCAATVAKELNKMRVLRKTFAELWAVVDGTDKPLAAVVKRIGQMGESALVQWEDKLDLLDESKKRIAYRYFVEGESLGEVALALDIDCDLLATKLRLIYETLAKVAA